MKTPKPDNVKIESWTKLRSEFGSDLENLVRISNEDFRTVEWKPVPTLSIGGKEFTFSAI